MEYAQDKVDETVLALLYLVLHDYNRAWKGFNWDILERIYEKGSIEDPKNKNKSMTLRSKTNRLQLVQSIESGA